MTPHHPVATGPASRLPSVQADGVLRAIERRITFATARMRQAIATLLTGGAPNAADPSTARVRPRDLERYAAQWRLLVPAGAELRADLAHRLVHGYGARAVSGSGIRAALSFDDPEVRNAYRDRYGIALEALGQAPDLPWPDDPQESSLFESDIRCSAHR